MHRRGDCINMLRLHRLLGGMGLGWQVFSYIMIWFGAIILIGGLAWVIVYSLPKGGRRR